jgi:hypothetical protein
MPTIKLISFHPNVEAKAATLKARGRTVDFAPLVKTSSVVGELARLNPASLVLDLDKLPSHAREIAVALRSSKSARHIPLLFAGGDLEKIARIRSQIPDAVYTSWSNAPRALTELLQQPAPASVVTFKDMPSTTPLPQKLGIKPDDSLAVMAAPDGFKEQLGDLPTITTSRLTPNTALALCFVRSLSDLNSTVDMLSAHLPGAASAWIIYPKTARYPRSGFNENHVRNAGLAINLVDYKVCSIDGDWSALKFAWRRSSAR